MGFIWFYVALCILQGSTMFYQDTGVSCCDELSFCSLRKSHTAEENARFENKFGSRLCFY